MKYFILSASHRSDSQTGKVSRFIEGLLLQRGHQVTLHDCGLAPLPIWSEDRSGELWTERWASVKGALRDADALIFATPEWQGMATPQAKNFFLLCSQSELGHKAGLLVSVSAGRGGAYPIAELRSSSYKNTRINWIPEHLIIRQVEGILNQVEPEASEQWIRDRIHYALTHLELYASALLTIRDQLPIDPRFGNGM